MKSWSKEQEIAFINEKQRYYVDELIKMLNSKESTIIKTINFNSSTGTGKTKMMAELFNKMNDKFFVITTLSRGQLHKQIKQEINKFAKYDNFTVYGLQDYTTATNLTAEKIIALFPEDKEIIWIRDEGHINTNRWEEILLDRCINRINFSATNTIKHGISCNFIETMMLRTVSQKVGNIEEAIVKLMEVKKLHNKVANYNPCALFRLITINQETLKNEVIHYCEQYKLKYIDLTNDEYIMTEICKDDNEYDVIINKMKIVEGIDVRRAHVLFMDNKPGNLATTVQIIGRCRRNALLWRNDVDILAPNNEKLLEDTRRCYVFFNIVGSEMEEANGQLLYELCDHISVEQLSDNSEVYVKKGVMPNGLQIAELEKKTGRFVVKKDKNTGFMTVNNKQFYAKEIAKKDFDIIVINDDSAKSHAGNKANNLYREIPIAFIKQKWKLISGAELNVHEKESLILGESKIEDLNRNHGFKKPYYREDYYELQEREVPYYKISKKLENIVFQESTNELGEMIITCVITHCISYADIENKMTDYNNIILGRYKEYWKNILANKPDGETMYTWKERKTSMPEIDGITFLEWSKILANKPEYETVYKYNINKRICTGKRIFKDLVDAEPLYFNYEKIYNDQESAIIGIDKFNYMGDKWVEDKAVSSKISMHSKFNSFITKNYAKEINLANKLKFTGKNNFSFDKKQNTYLGICVEYYAKYLFYGKRYLDKHLKISQSEYIKEKTKELYKTWYADKIRTSELSPERQEILNQLKNEINDVIIIRAGILCYQENMANSYGNGIYRFNKGLSTQKLLDPTYSEYIKTISDLGHKTYEFIKMATGINTQLDERSRINDPNLSIKHITALCDFLTEDKIIELKTTNCIDDKHIRQVLAYHYLSTKRSDLNIKQVIIYDSISNKHICIDINAK